MQNRKGTEVPLGSMAGRKYSLFAGHAQGTVKQDKLATELAPLSEWIHRLKPSMVGNTA